MGRPKKIKIALDKKEKKLFMSYMDIKKMTPFLDNIEPPLTNKQRAFVYHFSTNGNKRQEALLNSGYMVEKITSKDPIIKRKAQITANSIAYTLLHKENVAQAIKLFNDKWIESKKESLGSTLIDALYTQATYDPSMFYTEAGTPKFRNWKQIPKPYRCCVTHLETKFYGRDAQRETIIMKLVDRNWALGKLLEFTEIIKNNSIAGLGDISDEKMAVIQEIFDRVSPVHRAQKETISDKLN